MPHTTALKIQIAARAWSLGFREFGDSCGICDFGFSQCRAKLCASQERESVWLNQQQLAQLFGRERSVVTKHIRSVFRNKELEPTATSANFAQVQIEGARRISRDVTFYNLDVIIAVGYRVNSKRGTQFRIWATRTLREHLVRGFTAHPKRLAERGLDEARQTLDLLARTLQTQSLVDDTGRAVLDLITRYADT